MSRRRKGWTWLPLGLVGVLACQEAVTAPGACPAFCPPEALQVVDSLLVGVIVSDSTFEGFAAPLGAERLAVSLDPTVGGLGESRAVLRFDAFLERLTLSGMDTTTGLVVRVDSFGLTIPVVRRSGGSDMALVVHRLPSTIDTLVTFASSASFFADSTRIAVARLHDTLTTGVVEVVIPGDAFPTLDADGRVAAIGLAIQGTEAAYVSLGSADAAISAQLTRFVGVQDTDGGTVNRQGTRITTMDTFVALDGAAAPAGVLRVGGTTAARSFFRFDLPPNIVDSADIVRATLLLVPVQPAIGVPGDTLTMIAQGLTADLGPKSPLRTVPSDSVPLRSAHVSVGSTDTVLVDVTDVFRSWTVSDSLPRILALRAVSEGSSRAEIWLGSTPMMFMRPTVRVTFVPQLRLSGR